MRITVLGKSPAWQDAGGACSGYLVREGDYQLLLDCGNGVFSKLRHVSDYVSVAAVVISHLHADHFFDLVPFSYALSYAPRQQPVPVAGWPGTDSPVRPVLFAPSGAREVFRRISGCWHDEELIERAFDLHEYGSAEELAIGPFRARLCEVPHYVTSHAVDLSSNGSGRLTFSGDCRPNEELVQFARDTDFFLIEATLPRPERDGARGHLTPREAGDHARRAGAHRVAITHFSDELDSDWARTEAAEGYGSPVELAQEGSVFTI